MPRPEEHAKRASRRTLEAAPAGDRPSRRVASGAAPQDEVPRAGAIEIGAATSRAEALRALAQAFAARGIDEPQREARLALCAAGAFSPASLIAAPEAPLDEGAAVRLREVVERRLSREPLSRITGAREFWGLDLRVTPDVLDPRPETETLVEAALEALRGRTREPLRILDLGVGSGAILSALLSECPAALGVGVDASPAAAAVARANVEACGLAERAAIRVGDWTNGVEGPFDLIVSNPPYVRTADIDALAPEVRDFDPRLALDGGADGLDAYRAILPAAHALLRPEGVLVVEVGAGQADDVRALAAESGFVRSETRRDLARVERVVIGWRAP
jgi:release factor glutamine methyltransferase